MKVFAAPILILFLMLTHIFSVSAQEENATAVKEGSRYTDLKIHSLEKFNSRVEHQQDRMIKKLKKKEKHFEHKLKSSDSLAYAKYKQQRAPSYDSISKVLKADTGKTAANFSKQKNASVDSLRGVTNFVQNKSCLSTSVPETQGKNAEMSQLQGKLNFKAYITQLITQRMSSLKMLGSSSNIPGLTGMEKQVFYGKAKMNVYKDIEEDPSKAEDKAMEYLQGTEGFDKSMRNATDAGGGSSGMSGDASQLQQMGYQTKQQLQNSLQKKFGGNLGMIASNATAGLKQMQDLPKEILGEIKDSKHSLPNAENINKPSFKVNTMRGLPFWKRIEKQFNWQATHASTNGSTTSIVEPSAMIGYKQTAKLTYGFGIETAIGLGQNWSNVHLSFQGVGFRSFATWQWQYGIGFYAGYERIYDNFLFKKNQQNTPTDISATPHNNTDYNESVLIGLTKTYSLNKRFNGQMQLLYDIWWQQKGLSSPFVLRFSTTTK